MPVYLFLVHHGEAVGPEVDPRRPLSPRGRRDVVRAAEACAARGGRPAAIWHSGKLRARETAEAFRKACNPFAEFSAVREVQPADAPEWIRDRLRGETRDVMIVGHFPHLPRLLTLLLGHREDSPVGYPQHGVVALSSDDEGESWTESWRWEVE